MASSQLTSRSTSTCRGSACATRPTLARSATARPSCAGCCRRFSVSRTAASWPRPGADAVLEPSDGRARHPPGRADEAPGADVLPAEFLATPATLLRKVVWWRLSGRHPHQPWFDFYPFIENAHSQFADRRRQLLETRVRTGAAPKEQATGDAFVSGQSAVSIAGPWAIAVYGDRLKWGAVPVLTKQGMPVGSIHTFLRREIDRHVLQLQKPWDCPTLR